MKEIIVASKVFTFMYALLVYLTIVTLANVNFAYGQDCPVQSFKGSAEKLDLSKIESVLTLAKVFEDQAKHQTPACNETLFVEFRKVYYKARSEYEKAVIGGFNEPYPMEAKKEKVLRSKLNQVGWDLFETEGTYYIGENGKWFLDRFNAVLTKPLMQYLTQRRLEVRERFSEDAGLLITWEDFLRRIEFWESFLKQNPAFPLKDEINMYLDVYIRTFLTGLDNAPITVEYNNMALRKDVKTAFETYLKRDKGSRYYRVVEGYYKILERSGFVVSDELKRYLDAQGIKSMKAVQPPTY